MNRSLLIGLGAGAATAVGAVANYSGLGRVAGPVRVAAPAQTAGVVERGAIERADAPLAATAPTANVDVPERTAPQPRPAEPMAAPVARSHERTATPRPRAEPARYARVVSVEPVEEDVREPREVCRDEPVVKQAPVRDEHRIAGTLLGAALGGVLGNQVGGGDGKKIATVAGAAAGGYAGNRVQDRVQRSNTVTTTERRCETVYDQRAVTRGYDVTYTYEGRIQKVRMDRAPGDTLPARDGRVLTASR